MEFGTANTIVLGVYLGLMLLIGLLLAGRQKTTEEYFLAGRRMPWLVVAMSMFASMTSASTFLGVPGIAYEENVAIFFGVLISPIVAPILIFLIYPYYRRLNVSTSYEYIFLRYGQGARYVVSFLFILARLFWLGVVIYAPALAVSATTGIEISVAIFLMGVLATAYTVLGGLAAVLWTDMVQFLILVGGAVWMVVNLLKNVPGGYEQIMTMAREAGRLDVFSRPWDLTRMTAAAAAFSWFFVFLHDYGTDQVTVQRLIATRDMRRTGLAIVFNSISDCAINAILLLIGLGLLAYYQINSGILPEGMTRDQIMPFYIMHTLPPGVSGLVLTAVFAAAMSSMDSGINSISAVVVNDLVKPLRGGLGAEAGYVRLARALTVVLGALATLAAFYAARIGSIVEAWSSFLSLFAGPILALFLWGILSCRVSFYNWIFGCVISFTFTVAIQNLGWVLGRFGVETSFQVHWVWYMPFSFLICLVITFLMRLIAPGPLAPPGTNWFSPDADPLVLQQLRH
ncbi:MAG: sodium/solute symporter [Sedimentisphaerales bacterium]|nr:sodium/solute symporter [Sedimentisphaerales bacterium]